jgi:hypothetical protein
MHWTLREQCPFKHSTCILVWGINILYFTDIFCCVRMVNMLIIYGNFSIVACYSSFIIHNSNWKTVFYVTFKCKLWTKVIRLNTNICIGNIFQSSLPNLSCPKCVWILNFSSYDFFTQNGPVHFSLGMIEISGSHIGEYEDGCSGILCHVVWNKLTDVSEVLAASIIRSSHWWWGQ